MSAKNLLSKRDIGDIKSVLQKIRKALTTLKLVDSLWESTYSGFSQLENCWILAKSAILGPKKSFY